MVPQGRVGVVDHQPSSFAFKPTLRGERVLLRPFQEDDLPAIAEALVDPEVVRLTGSTHRPPAASGQPPALDDVGRRWYLSRNEQPDRLDLAVVDLATDRCVGEVVLNEWDEENASCNFRTLIGPAGRGRGLGTEAASLIIGYGFEALDLHRISLEVFDFNPRARRVYEKVGFVAEGTLREVLRTDGGWADATVMSILSADWVAAPEHQDNVG